jgi:hypothetical protein
MSTPYESAQLILKIFELRRDPLLRDARDWFLRDFHPESADDVVAVLSGDENAKLRMVVGYWDMAASFVTHDALDRQMFLDANPEMIPTFAKVQPFLGELRERFDSPDFLRHIEGVVMSLPGAEERLEGFRQRLKSLAKPSRGSAGY